MSNGYAFCGDLYLSQIFWVEGYGVEFDPYLETTIFMGSPEVSINIPPATTPQGKLLTVYNHDANFGKVKSNPAGIECGSTCSSFFALGQTVELTAHPVEGYQVFFWGRDCDGRDTCKLVMDGDKEATIYFSKISGFGLNAATDGNGYVKSNPPGIDCETTCNAAFQINTLITLEATPKPTFRFSKWSGDCSESKTPICTLDMTKDMQVKAYFESAVPQKTLTVTTKGSGTVYDSLGLINCGDQCTASYNRGTKVSLTVTPDEGWKFKKWSGACSGKRACTVNLKAKRKVTAVFIPQ